MNILITGGCGYIGSCLAKMINQNFKNYKIIILDDLSTGNKEVMKKIKANFFFGKINNKKILKDIFKQKIDLVIHLAAKAIVSESVIKPDIYLKNNFYDAKKFLDFCTDNGVKKILFSSTCNLYKFSNKKMTENQTVKLNSPYAKSKLMFEKYLSKVSKEKKISFFIFRFFNVSGSFKNVGELHKRETHLIPNVINALINDKSLNIFGKNFNTKDGTAIRDYIHVEDICLAFLKTIKILNQKKSIKKHIFNLGSNNGTSIKDIVNITSKIYRKNINIRYKKSRIGDPPVLVASTNKAKKYLNWIPKNSNINNIIISNYKFYKKLKQAKN